MRALPTVIDGCDYEVYVRGRIEATGNDPDSGFLPLMLGTKPQQKPA